MSKYYASKMLFTTAEGQIVCNYIFIDDGKLFNVPLCEQALTSSLSEQFKDRVFSPHPEVMANIVPNERPEDYLRSLPYLYNGTYYRATRPEWLDIEFPLKENESLG